MGIKLSRCFESQPYSALDESKPEQISLACEEDIIRCIEEDFDMDLDPNPNYDYGRSIEV